MRYFLVVLALSLNFNSSAQLNGKYTFRHLDQTDGLLHTSVRGIGQDAEGYIWILTLNGLQRYDGLRFINYQEVLQVSPNYMNLAQLYVDTIHHQVWVMKGQYVERLNMTTHLFSTYDIKETLMSDPNHLPELYTDKSGDQYLIGIHGVVRYKKDTQDKLGSIFNENPDQLHRTGYIVIDSLTNEYWFHDYQFLLITDRSTHQLHTSSDSTQDHPLLRQWRNIFDKKTQIRYLMRDSYHNVWISTWDHRLARYNLDTKLLKVYSLKEVARKQHVKDQEDNTLLINFMHEDRQKNLWMATDYAGLLLYNRKTDDFNYITTDEKISNGLRYNFMIYCIFQDRDDNIWLGTDRGISIFNPYRNYFQVIRHLDATAATIPKQEINDVVETSTGEILIATWGGGISVYDHDLHFVRNILLKGPEEYNLVWCFVESEDGMIWVGTQAGYIHLYNPVTHDVQTIRPEEIEHSTIRTMTKDRHGNILFGLHNGKTVMWNLAEKKFYPFHAPSDNLHFSYGPISNIFIDHHNHIWVGTENGIMAYDSQENTYVHLYQPEPITSSNGIVILGMEEYNDSLLIVGSLFRGIYLLNRNSGIFSRPFKDEKLNLSSVYAIKKDQEGQFWFTTDFSIYKMSPDATQPVQFKIDYSTINSNFGSNRFYALKDGRWATSTFAELVFFNPDHMESGAMSRLKAEISGFKVQDENINIDEIRDRGLPVRLPHNQNFISIEFSSLDFSNIRQPDFYYRLSPLNRNWIHSTSKAFADYTDLHPGEYTFEVTTDQAKNPKYISSLSIIIQPPWWGTIWFRLLAVLTLAAGIFGFVRTRIRSIRKQADLKHQIAETEMMALRSQMNPHFIFNCLNSIDAMIQSNDKYKATVYLNKFAKMIRNVLDSSTQNKVPFYKDFETLQLYVDLELFRYQGKFISTIYADDELLKHDYRVPPLIIQPYVENAIHHGLRHRPDNNGSLTINITKVKDEILYVVEDNGIGRKGIHGEQDKKEKGYGMQMSSDRIRLFNNEATAWVQVTDLMEDGVASGTRVEVRLKMQ